MFVALALILAYIGAALHVALNAERYWVFPAFYAAMLGLGYAIGNERDRAHMRETWLCVTDWLRR